VYSEATYGVPPERVVGSGGTTSAYGKDGKPFLTKEPKLRLDALQSTGRKAAQPEEAILAMGRRTYYELVHCGRNWYTSLQALSPRTKPGGAVEWIRTTDLLITNQLLYQLSYNSPGDRRHH
jgi:hypothetical protein